MSFIKKIYDSQLFKVSSLNTISVFVRVLGGLISSKIIALFLGPSGLALIGNYRNFLSALDSFSTLGFQNGIVKYTAQNEHDEKLLSKVVSTVFITLLFVVLIVSILLFFASSYLNNWIFNEENQYGWIFKVSAFALPWYAGNIIFIAFLNGIGKFSQVIRINIYGNVIGVLLSAVLIWLHQVPGALLSLILSSTLVFVFSFYEFHKHFKYISFFEKGNFDVTILKGLFSYSLMSLVTAILAPTTFFLIRDQLFVKFGANEAGFWEAINRLSTFYMMFAATLLTVYFLPKLSISKTTRETKAVFWSYYKGIVPVFLIGLIIVFFMKGIIVKILFSKEFLPMENLFLWQLLGDFFKICYLILGYEFLAKKMTKAYILFELLSFSVLFISSKYMITLYGSEGAVMAHAFTYFICMVSLGIFFNKYLFTKKDRVSM